MDVARISPLVRITLFLISIIVFNIARSSFAASSGEVLNLLENWRGASFSDVIHQTSFGEPGEAGGMKAADANDVMEQ
jgi:hypothetical protein